MHERFTAEFDALFRVSYRAAFAILGDRSEAEDCAQEALARALVRWRRIEEYAAPWVAKAASNRALDLARRRQRREDRPLTDDTPVSAALGSDLMATRRRDLTTALQNLPRRQRDAIVLRHLADLSEADAAQAMGCSIGTVKSAVSRGVDRLRYELGPNWLLEA